MQKTEKTTKHNNKERDNITKTKNINNSSTTKHREISKRQKNKSSNTRSEEQQKQATQNVSLNRQIKNITKVSRGMPLFKGAILLASVKGDPHVMDPPLVYCL